MNNAGVVAEEGRERRGQPRLRLRGTIIVGHAGARLMGRVSDISLEGAGVYVQGLLPAGGRVRLDIPVREGAVAVVRARVAHSVLGCAGLRFLWAGADDPNRLLLREALGGCDAPA